jgi:hypothetical protein
MELNEDNLKDLDMRGKDELFAVLEKIDREHETTQHSRVRARNGTTRLAIMYVLGLYDVTYLPNGEAHFTPNDALESIRAKRREG